MKEFTSTILIGAMSVNNYRTRKMFKKYGIPKFRQWLYEKALGKYHVYFASAIYEVLKDEGYVDD